MTIVQTAGLFVGGVGVVAAGVGTILAINEILVLEDPASLTADKDRARVLAWVGLGVAAVGLAAAGGGAGMVLAPEPIFATVEAVQPPRPILYLGPAGRRLDQAYAR